MEDDMVSDGPNRDGELYDEAPEDRDKDNHAIYIHETKHNA